MKTFATLQSDFQRAILDGDDGVLAEILDSPKETRGTLFGVYRRAYGLRLTEAMRTSYALLHSYVGDEMFDEMGAAYIAKHPSHHPNMRWYAQTLPAFLAETEPYSDYPILTELAAVESALNDAFDAPDGAVLTMADLSVIDPSIWHDLVFERHCSVRRFRFVTNVLAIWGALHDDACVPDVESDSTTKHLVVWRQDATSMIRALGVEEAMMWDEAASGIPFGQLCAMLATYDDPDGAAGRAAAYLGQWIASGMLASAAL
jgi:hypothetical protein